MNKTLLVVGHGSISQKAAEKVLQGYGAYISSNTNFKNVEVGAILGEPNLEMVMSRLSGNVTVLPIAMCNRHLIPDRLEEIVDGREDSNGVLELEYLPLVGENDKFPLALKKFVDAALSDSIFDGRTTVINLVAHGSKRRPASRMMTQRLQEFLKAGNFYKNVVSSFLEEPPFFNDVAKEVSNPTISIGLFVGGGTHALNDIKGAMEKNPNENHVYGGTIGDHTIFKNLLVHILTSS